MTKLHEIEPGHVSITIAAADEATAAAMAEALNRCHNVTGPSDPYRVPGVPGVRVHLYGHTDPVDADEDEASTRCQCLLPPLTS
ncbi:DUF6207 family protein [Streptomyces sp. BH055]|uniref:DUF6207 family protein n=1 Tax=unclassified Streptomyces TaxID=2593676 RepID=UPI003BB69331